MKRADLSGCLKKIEGTLKRLEKIKEPEKKKEFLPEWSQVNRLSSLTNALRQFTERGGTR